MTISNKYYYIIVNIIVVFEMEAVIKIFSFLLFMPSATSENIRLTCNSDFAKIGLFCLIGSDPTDANLTVVGLCFGH